MNRHTLADELLLAASRIAGKPFFRASIDTPPFGAHLAATLVDQPEFRGPGYYPVALDTLAGPLSAAFRVAHWRGYEAPTLIYHQGGAEQPFDRTIRKLYPDQAPAPINVIVVQTPCQGSLKELNRSFAHLNTYLAMIASVVKMTESLIASPELARAGAVAVSGYSLGGFVTGRHHDSFNTADVYIPFMAGTRHGDIFFTSIRAGRLANANRDHVRSRLNFDRSWRCRDHPNVFPVVGRHDRLNRLDVQAPSYDPTPVEIWEGGHLYGVRRPALMRAKIERHLFDAARARQHQKGAPRS